MSFFSLLYFVCCGLMCVELFTSSFGKILPKSIKKMLFIIIALSMMVDIFIFNSFSVADNYFLYHNMEVYL